MTELMKDYITEKINRELQKEREGFAARLLSHTELDNAQISMLSCLSEDKVSKMRKDGMY